MASKKSNGAVPEGFKEVDNSLAGFWKPEEKGQSLQGAVSHMIETKGAEGKPNKFYAVRITDPSKTHGVVSEDKAIEVEQGDLVGVGGAILLSFLTGREGQEVFLVYKGMGAKKAGKNAPRLFTTYARDFDAELDGVVG